MRSVCLSAENLANFHAIRQLCAPSCSGHIGVGVSLLSYAGMVRMGVAADAGLVPDPEAITAAFEVLAERTIGGP
jgi:hypothetical protein